MSSNTKVDCATLLAQMKVFKIVIVSVLSVILIAGLAFFLIGYFKPKPAGIAVRSTPDSYVYIDDKLIGKTPIDTTIGAGSVTLKIVPDGNRTPYEAKINLISGVKTIVKREFGEAESSSSGEIVSFEKESGSVSAGIVVVSTPDNAQVDLDGVSRGFSPVKLSSVQGEHQLVVKSPGYNDRNLRLRTISGYKLTVLVQLAKVPEVVKEEPKVETQTFVEILKTPTGFLRVRSEPGSGGAEIDQVAPGAKFLLLDTDASTGWYKIQLEAPVAGLPNGRFGWVSNQYATQSAEVTPVSQ